MQEKLEEKTVGNTWLAWTGQSQRADCRRFQLRRVPSSPQSWLGQTDHKYYCHFIWLSLFISHYSSLSLWLSNHWVFGMGVLRTSDTRGLTGASRPWMIIFPFPPSGAPHQQQRWPWMIINLDGTDYEIHSMNYSFQIFLFFCWLCILSFFVS